VILGPVSGIVLSRGISVKSQLGREFELVEQGSTVLPSVTSLNVAPSAVRQESEKESVRKAGKHLISFTNLRVGYL
jgi:hypothetical protein